MLFAFLGDGCSIQVVRPIATLLKLLCYAKKPGSVLDLVVEDGEGFVALGCTVVRIRVKLEDKS